MTKVFASLFGVALFGLVLVCLVFGCYSFWVQAQATVPTEEVTVNLGPLESELNDHSKAIDALAGSVESQGEEISDLSASIDDLVETFTEPVAPAPQPEEEAAPTPEAPPTSSSPPTQPEEIVGECLQGVTTGQAQSLTGISVQRLAEECSAFVWRGAPDESVEATCPSGWVCTLDVVDDITVVHEGVGQGAEIHAGTFREVSAYPRGDAVHNVCQLFENERDLGLREDPSFEVRFQPVPGGIQQCS